MYIDFMSDTVFDILKTRDEQLVYRDRHSFAQLQYSKNCAYP